MKTISGRLPGSDSVVRIDYRTSIQSVDELIEAPETADFIAPGFVDVQVNGFAGVDYNDPNVTPEEITKSIAKLAETGVSRCYPTVITGSFERISGALRNLAQISHPVFAGFHVEGPYISPEDGPRGAHPREHVRPPDFDEFERMQEAAQGKIRLITVSPEWDPAPRFIENVVRTGVVVSVGHTKANRAQIQAAVDAGASMSTHLGNGAHAVLPKTENYIWDQLAETALSPSFIVDGIHIPPPFLRAALRAKGTEHSVLVSDAVMPAMCPPGDYQLGQVPVTLHANGSVTLRGGTRLAGSALTMDRAVANTVQLGSVSLREAIAMATVNPARVARVAARTRGLSPGDDADFVRFRMEGDKLIVLETIVAGETAFRRDAN